jgi:hypothetical protein
MWFKETINDLYNAKVQNDHLSLLCETNKKCKVAVKTPVGTTSRMEIEEVIMQGGVWGPLECSVQIDSLGRECLTEDKCLYKYKESVDIPPLAMIDDVAAFSVCGSNSVKLNTVIETKVKTKKLEFAPDKCHNMHIGKNKSCSVLYVHDNKMKEVDSEKYLGDILSNDCSIDENIDEREKKGVGIVTQMSILLKEVSLGKHYFTIGILFRNTNVINGILTNSEVWYKIRQKHIKTLENIDEMYLRKMLEAHSKTPIEALYIETGTMPIRYILKMRRLMYWWHLIVRSKENSLIKKVYMAQKANPVANDWVKLIDEDKDDLGIQLNDHDLKIKYTSKSSFRKYLKFKVNSKSEEYLGRLKESHSKLNNIGFQKLQCADYLKDPRITEAKGKILFKLRTRMYQVRCNFKNQYGNNLTCQLCKQNLDQQSHLLECVVMKSLIPELKNTSIKYEDIFGDVNKMSNAAELFLKITEQREEILNTLNSYLY